MNSSHASPKRLEVISEAYQSTIKLIVRSFSTELALRFEYDGDEIANHLKKRSKELVLAQVSELVPFPKEEQKNLVEYGLYCATIAY